MARDFEEYRAVYEQFRKSGAMDLILAHLREAGIESSTIPTLDEVIASGLLMKNELQVRARNMVDPRWLDRPAGADPDRS